ncbi:MAG TPA: outer membrane lipid asymmetry maintenance protein MlaD [Rhizomicrobium sp.]|jgi:phospholipid/cholesterol/gamma-HCH transport system substrate-binding protein|nr:outer membrane lipid asymmetry maintenance protein MlaD [Rhizomicrobium sp.]
MQNNTFETLMGAFVILVAAGFLYFAYTSTGVGSLGGYELSARFASADGIATGTDVRLHGIKIGRVDSMRLDPKTYAPIVKFSVRSDIKIPDDSSIKITSAGIMGSSYLAIQPGGSEKTLPPGGEITNTQGSIDLMSLIGRAIYGNSGSK